MLQTLTLSYPDSTCKGPKIMILFTFFSRFELENQDQNLDDSYESEDDKKEIVKENENSTLTQDPIIPNDNVTFENLIQRFKSDLMKQINEDQGLTQPRELSKTAQIVETLFPDSHFFTFKLFSEKQKAT